MYIDIFSIWYLIIIKKQKEVTQTIKINKILFMSLLLISPYEHGKFLFFINYFVILKVKKRVISFISI